MIPFMGKRRNIVIAVLAALLVLVALSSGPTFDTERIKNFIPGHYNVGHDTAGHDNAVNDHASHGNAGHGSSIANTRTSQMHFLIPASAANIHLCYNMVSAVANRYPVPMLLGWHGTGLLDAHKTHLAKLRAIQRYLHKLDAAEDDDLVVIVDGYDIIMQMPPEVMIDRYFKMADKADARLARRFGITVDEARSRGLRQTIFWGPDKICWPIEWRAARCWAVPTSNLGPKAFGPKSGNGEMYFADPRWLNSGTVIGPTADMRRLVDATMDEIEATYDAEFPQSESDQYYLSNVWGRQEYFRSVAVANGGEVPGGPKDREIPRVREDDQETEYHIAIDYESALFQTKAGYEPFFGYMQYNQTGLKAKMDIDMFDLGEQFQPYDIEMPSVVAGAMAKLYDAIPEAHPGSSSEDWLSTVSLGTNYVSRHIYALWHCTGPKEWIDKHFPTLWFYPFVRPLLRAAVKASQSGDLISTAPIGGRHWAPKTWFPEDAHVLGGAWTDKNGTTFVPWAELCGGHEDILFGGEAGYMPPSLDEEELATEEAAGTAADNAPVNPAPAAPPAPEHEEDATKQENQVMETVPDIPGGDIPEAQPEAPTLGNQKSKP
ncbi:hypothetical protein S7711_07614 [Stachybotrys chartarum IBT 7711]|uniref:Uncharacterized protein n=1 Tax=Stachybotrys chartarum (strain CBS 109288 / IBT 7711) TaxID=1280523 RepID=A0A084BCI1_STACB|nr:hypothetical protein S7711_07614 [Stachybotrys chartarum IBT 7711]KFA78025.1 hypothetical protein S40288_07447 [Stachybotrys chartarum IBT 40288]